MSSAFKLLFLLLVIPGSGVLAQVEKPRVYIDPDGRRFTKIQFDSISAANIGKPIAMIDKTEKEKEIQFTFEILTINPFDEFRKKWVGQPFPVFELKDIGGKTYQNSSVLGKVVVFNFWSTTCAPCIEEMPRLNELVRSYSKEPVVFLAPAPEQTEKIENRVAKNPFIYTILPNAGSLFGAMGIDGYPYHIIVDKAGIIKAIYHGSRVNQATKQPILNEGIVKSIDEMLTK